MDLDVFSNDVVATDAQISFFTFIGLILRRITQYRPGVDLVFLADFSPPAEIGMRHHARTAANLHAAFDYNLRTDLDIAGKLGTSINHRGRVNTHGVKSEISNIEIRNKRE